MRLHGELGNRFGNEFKLQVVSPGEALRALASQLPGFMAYLIECAEAGQKWTVLANDDPLTVQELNMGRSAEVIYSFVPEIQGAGGDNALLAGVALVAIGLATGGAGFAAWDVAAKAGLASLASYGALQIGGLLVLGGVAQMLVDTPSTGAPQEQPENAPSYLYNGPVNTVQQGQPVPLLYGEMIVGSAVVSAGIYSDRIYE